MAAEGASDGGTASSPRSEGGSLRAGSQARHLLASQAGHLLASQARHLLAPLAATWGKEAVTRDGGNGALSDGEFEVGSPSGV